MIGGGLGLGDFMRGALGRMPKYSKTEEEMVEIATARATARMEVLVGIAMDASGTSTFPDLLTVTHQVFEEMLARVRMEHHIPDEDDGEPVGLPMRKPRDIRPDR